MSEFSAAFPSESEFVERKSGFNRTAVQEASVAFSNIDGGVILIGVDDIGAVVGRELTPRMLDDIHTAMREARDPGRYSVHELRVDDKPVVVLSIARRVEGFSQTSSGRVLVRRGTMKVALFGGELARFINERSLQRFEETEAAVTLDEADAGVLSELATAFGWSRDVPDRLAEQGLLTRNGQNRLTIAGALCLLSDPAERLGKAFIEILRFPADGAEYDKRSEIRGALHHQLQRTSRRS
ncbi:MAG: AlbA family DNA-binding domain-containing protein [Gaiellaceae bacterium]